MRMPTLTPCSHSSRSESASENQNSSSDRRNSTGSLRMPPRSLHKITYFPCSGLMRGGVAGDDVVHEPLRVRPLHPDLPLHRHVPHGDVVGQRLVLGGGPAVLGADVAARMVDAVVDRGAPAARLVRQVPVGRLAHAVGDQQLGGRTPALAQVDRNDAVGLVDALRLCGHDCSLGARLNGSRANSRRTIGSKNSSGSES